MIISDNYSLLMLVFVALLGGYVFVFGVVRKFNEWYNVGRVLQGRKKCYYKYPLPPGDMGWPLLGNFVSFIKAFRYGGDPDSFIATRISRYGRTGIYKTYLFGSPSIIVCSPETCKKVMMDDERFKLGYPKGTMILAGRRAFHNISNSEHKWLRRLTTSPINGHEALSVYVEYIEKITVYYLEEWSSSDRPIELWTELRKAAFKVITYIFMGPGCDSVIKEVRDLYTDLNVGMKSQVINLPGFAFHKALQARKKLVKILQTVLDRKREKTRTELDANEKSVIDLLMNVKDEEGRQLEDEDIIDLLLLFLLAGHESSAHGTMWAIIYLTQHPHFLIQAKEEQEAVMKRRATTQKGLTLKEIKQMPYLSKVIDETLRRTSISFSNFREAKVDVHINGYTIPKGWKVLVWNRGVHMDPETYTNPKEFDPERWENHQSKPGTFLPFGMGSRLCPGADLAKLEIAIFLHHFLLYYKIERLNPTASVNYLPIPRPTDNCLARVIKVNP